MEAITFLRVTHKGKKLVFWHPEFKGTLFDVAEKIDRENLKRPSSPEISSLLNGASENPNNFFSSKVLSLPRDLFLWEYTGNLYLPKKPKEEVYDGVIIEHNPAIEEGRLVMNKNSLIKKLYEGDPNVKFVPFGYKTGEQSLGEFKKNRYNLARYNEEGVEKLIEYMVNMNRFDSNFFRELPTVWSPNPTKVETEFTTLSTILAKYNKKLIIDANDSLSSKDYMIGYSFGIKSDFGSSRKFLNS